MNRHRIFSTSAAARYDRALSKSLKLNPVPPGCAVPQPTRCWPAENIALLERFRTWLAEIGAADAVIGQHRIPMAGHVLGLNLKPHWLLNLAADLEKGMAFIVAKQCSAAWTANCRHSLVWFRRFLQVERGVVVIDNHPVVNVERYQLGLPAWLIRQLTKYLHLRQPNWRPARITQMTTQFWHKSTRIWRWLFEQTNIQAPQDVTRNHLFAYIDEQLVAGYKVATINLHLHTFQGTLRFLQEQGMAVSQAVLTLPGLKKPHSLPRFLTEAQMVALKREFDKRVAQARTTVAMRNAVIDRAMFYLLWHSGMRVSELEDLQQADVDLEARVLLIRAAKGLKDRSVYLTKRVTEAIQEYQAVRGPALTDHLFIYRHKPLAKDLIRDRLKATGMRAGVKATPHMLRHTFATQLVNAGAKITTIQALLGHVRLNTTMVYAQVHDQTVMEDYFRAMAHIEGEQSAWLNRLSPSHRAAALLDKMEHAGLSDEQRQILAELQACLAQQPAG